MELGYIVAAAIGFLVCIAVSAVVREMKDAPPDPEELPLPREAETELNLPA